MIQTVAAKISYWDTKVCSHIFGWNGKSYLDGLMLLLTRSGDGYLYIPFGIVLLLIDYSAAVMITTAGALAFMIELPAQKILKRLIKRSRPFENITGIHHLIKPPDKFSFPSGHTAGAFIIAMLFGTIYAAAFPVLIIWAAGVGISRVYNGVHYPTDVIAGAILGSLSAYAGYSIVHLISI